MGGKKLLTAEEILQMSDDDYMDERQLAFFRQRLLDMEAELRANAGQTTVNLRETNVVPDPADRATIEEEHALELRTRDRERKLLKKVQAALQRIENGDYGYCEETGDPIGVARLMARPTATLSLEAQQRRELKQKMYGDCSEPNFLGYEGPSDHSADMLYTFDEQRQLTGALVCIPCPSQVYELHRFISADYWGEVRTQLRAELGNIFVLPLCGAAGDQNPLDLVRISKDNKRELIVWNAQETEVDRSFDMLRECQQIGGRICDAVLRGYRQARNEIQTRPVFRTNCFEMDVPLRTVEKADVDAAGARIEAVKAACPAGGRLTEAQMIRCFEDIGYLNRWKLQQETTRFTFPIFVFRIGAAAFATNPFELYVDYSYRMKARCKARQAFIIQLSSNAKGGYLPTQIAVDGGSYGSKPVSTMVGPEGGEELVEKTIAAMDALF